MLLALVILLGIFAFFTLYGAFSWGLILFKFWYWFLLPVFTTLPEIDYWQAVGLILFIGLFKNHQVNNTKEEDDKNTVGLSLLTPWIVLTMGFFIHLIIN